MEAGGGAAILSPEQYAAACAEVDRALDRCVPLRADAASELGVSGPALASIHSERIIKHMGRYHARAAAAAASVRRAVEAGTSLVAVATQARVPPTCVARVALEQCAGMERKEANAAVREPGRVADAGLRQLVRTRAADQAPFPPISHAVTRPCSCPGGGVRVGGRVCVPAGAGGAQADRGGVRAGP